MIVLGLDVSYSRTGLVWLEWDRPQPLGPTTQPSLYKSKTFEIARGEWRLGRAQNLLYTELQIQLVKPDLAVIEGSIQRAGRYSRGAERKRGIKVLTMLQELNGVFKAVLDHFKIPTLESSPTHMKKLIAMKGTADKSVVAREIKARFGIEFPGDEKKGFDLYDAAGLALVGLKHRGMPL